MPNTFAYFALMAWPLVTLYFFLTKEIRKAILFSILGSYMFLPAAVKFDLSGLPDLNKFTIATLSVLFCVKFIKKQQIGLFSLKGIPKLLFSMLLISPFLTALTNKEPSGFLPGLTMHDGISNVFINFVFMSPFFLGRKFFSQEEDQILLFKYIVLSALIYSLFILYEIRMSPQIQNMVYGFFPHSFLQQVRNGGFRAVVFMGHGLWVGFFISISVIAAAILWRLKIQFISLKTGYILFFLLVVLVLSKTLASLLYAFTVILALIMSPPKKQVKIAVLMAIIVMSYPILSINKLFPHNEFLEVATIVGGTTRTESLAFRFRNEKVLLEHAYEKPLFGWGGWGRNRVYNEAGRDVSVTDGKWILTFGIYGWFGMIAEFGLIFITILMTARNLKYARDRRDMFLLSSHALLVSIIFVDQVPNASLNPVYWMLVGALYGRVEKLTNQK